MPRKLVMVGENIDIKISIQDQHAVLIEVQLPVAGGIAGGADGVQRLQQRLKDPEVLQSLDIFFGGFVFGFAGHRRRPGPRVSHWPVLRGKKHCANIVPTLQTAPRQNTQTPCRTLLALSPHLAWKPVLTRWPTAT